MKNIVCFLIIFFCFTGVTLAQTFDYTDIKKNGVFLDIYPLNHDQGVGYLSINYERSLGKKKRLLLGFGIYPAFETDYTYIAFPIKISGLTSPLEKHHFEYGLSIAPSFVYDNTYEAWHSEVAFIMIPIMYRYQENAGWFARGGVNLILAYGVIFHPSISIGYKF